MFNSSWKLILWTILSLQSYLLLMKIMKIIQLLFTPALLLWQSWIMTHMTRNYSPSSKLSRFGNTIWKVQPILLTLLQIVRRGSHRGESLQNELGDERTCGMTLASAYVLRRLSATWSQLQMKERKSEWKWVLIGVSPLNTGDRVQ